MLWSMARYGGSVPGEALRDGAAAGAWASVLSGAPSTAEALLRGGDPLQASAAAGSILLPGETRRGRLLLAAVPVHLALSFGWAWGIALVAPRGREVPFGAAAGLAIAGLDLGVIGRRFPASARCARCPRWPTTWRSVSSWGGCWPGGGPSPRRALAAQAGSGMLCSKLNTSSGS